MFSVSDKQKVIAPTTVPFYIPEITVGGIDMDKTYYEYKAVREH